ncbi:MAG: AsmA-like C-terminal region-containing protein [Bacteroidota bacterium]|nr:AsmA family protein [Candidatus Kapabacteria bacterium]MDW8219345.1 AsmA-like C-terminal region-containing protein [Bacteroidota bacterium]
MKRFLTFLVLAMLLVIVILAALPLLFKDRIVQYAKSQANQTLAAKVDFGDIDISLLRYFPRVALVFRDVSIANLAPFDGDTLFSAREIALTIEPLSYIRNGDVEIVTLHMQRPRVYTHVLSDTQKNWQITRKEESSVEDTSTQSSLRLALKSYTITDGFFRFRSEPANRDFILENIQHEGSGDFAQQVFTLVTRTTALMTFSQRGSTYLDSIRTTLTAEIGVDIGKNIYTFKDNELTLNELHAGFEGSIGLPDDRDDIDFDLRFATRDADFKAFLSVLPTAYSSQLSDVKASGSVNIQGFVKGAYNDTSYPAFALRTVVNNGSAEHPRLPVPLKAVTLDCDITHPGGSLDRSVILLRQLSLLLAGNPFDMNLEARTLLSDPTVSVAARGRINLADIKRFLDFKALNTLQNGIITVDASFRGAMSAVKSKNYQRLDVAGSMTVDNLEIASDSLPAKIVVQTATLSLSPQRAMLSRCAILLGESDIALEGQLENLIGYALYDETLVGMVRLRSEYLNVNPWLKASSHSDSLGTPRASSRTNPDTVARSIELPRNIDFTMQASMQRLIFSNLDMQEAQGTMTLRNKILRFDNLGVKLLGARMIASGLYNTQTPLQPQITFSLQLADIGIRTLYEKFMTVREFVPFAHHMQGIIGMKVQLSTDLDQNLKPLWNTFSSNGIVNLSALKLEDFTPCNAIADVLKIDALRNPTLSKFSAFYEIKNGRLYIKPFKTTLAGINVSIEGSNGIDKSLDYIVHLTIPVERLSSAAFDALGALGGLNLAALKPKTIPVIIRVGGTFDNPIIQPSLEGAQNVGQQVLDAAQEEIKRRAEEEIQNAQRKLKEEAERHAKELEEKAKQEADRKARELEQKAKEELKRRLPLNIFGGKDTTRN